MRRLRGARRGAGEREEHLGHPPLQGEVIRIHPYEFTIEESTLRGAKTISVRTII